MSYKICQHCDKLFKPTSITQKYCNQSCKQAAYRRRKNPKSGSWSSLRERAQKGVKTKGMTLTKITCKHCGKERAYDQLSAILRDYCSDACKQAAYRERKKRVTGG